MLKKPTILCGLVLLSSLLYAQETTSVTAPSVPAEELVVSDEKEGNVSLDFRDADIQNVLRILSYKSGVNIVAGPEVTGLVTIQLKDVPWQKALDVILQTYGYAYEQRGNIITITTIENLKKRREDAAILSEQEPLVTQTFLLNYGKATDVIKSIEKMKSERGSIDYDERTNALIVRDTKENVEFIGQVIAELDSTTPQVLIEAKIIETTLSNTEKLGIDWVMQATGTGPQRPHIWPFTTDTANKYFPDNIPAAEASKFNYGTINFQQLQAVLELLGSRSETKILSNPRIVTLDNQKARIVVGTQYPLPQYTYNEEQARLQVNGWEYKDIGVIFEVTPHVNNAGFVTLDLEPKITGILDFVTVENTSLPRLSTEEAKTSVMIHGGETLVIAGLIKDQVTDVKKKTPLLGDVPFLGLLFRKNEKTVTKTDLLIFLTPHIITVDTPSE
ncbi:MAG: type IV pilus secretin PilQ [Candidatus Omnitrophica bacterium]|nr:type IV pilus secretin PilQ [Candidatus Omnitrophota bacterium]